MGRKKGKIRSGTVYLLLVIAVAEELWFEYFKIGSDRRYSLYIGLLPTAAGCLLLLCYRWHFIAGNYSALKGVGSRLLLLLYGLQGLLFSYLSFGVLAKAVWNCGNKIAADAHPAEQVVCPVLAFQPGKNSYIYYLFQGKKELLRVRYRALAPYEGEDPSQYVLQFTARKGLWNYYLVESWSIEKAAP